MLTQPLNSVPLPAARSRRRGFTSVETILVVGTLTVLTAVVFSVFSTQREKARCANTTTKVKWALEGILFMSLDYDNHVPLSLRTVLDSPYVPQQLTDSLEDLGEEHYTDEYGYIWEYTPLPGYYVLEPRFGGLITDIKDPAKRVFIRVSYPCGGVIEGYADGQTLWVRASDAVDEVQAQIDEIQRMGLEATIDILTLAGEEAPAPENLKEAVADPDIVDDVALSLDRNFDGLVTATDLLMAAYPPPPPGDENPFPGGETPFSILQNFVTDAVELLELDPEEEGFDEFLHISLEDLEQTAVAESGNLLSFENIAKLSIAYSADPDTAMSLASKLFAAEAADQRGELETRDNIFDAYRNQLDAQTGKTILPEDADTLKTLIRTLQPNP